jgi:hypothetical protein
MGNIQPSLHFVNDDLDMRMGNHQIEDEQILREIMDQNTFQVTPAIIGRIFYNLGKLDFKNKNFERTVYNNVDQFKDQFSRRLAFGFYYGALRLNSEPNIIYFARTEYENFFVDEGDLNYHYGLRKTLDQSN